MVSYLCGVDLFVRFFFGLVVDGDDFVPCLVRRELNPSTCRGRLYATNFVELFQYMNIGIALLLIATNCRYDSSSRRNSHSLFNLWHTSALWCIVIGPRRKEALGSEAFLPVGLCRCV